MFRLFTNFSIIPYNMTFVKVVNNKYIWIIVTPVDKNNLCAEYESDVVLHHHPPVFHKTQFWVKIDQENEKLNFLRSFLQIFRFRVIFLRKKDAVVSIYICFFIIPKQKYINSKLSSSTRWRGAMELSHYSVESLGNGFYAVMAITLTNVMMQP